MTMVGHSTRADVVLPLTTPITGNDGLPITALHLPRNTNVHIGIAAANRDPAVWGPDAEDFKPKRWLERENGPQLGTKEKFPGVYSGMMTFLSGGRACMYVYVSATFPNRI